jgi:transposase-like protein
MALKGQKFIERSAEEKLSIIKPILEMEKSSWDIQRETGINTGLLYSWIKKYRESGIEGLNNKKKPGNPLSKYLSKKDLTKEEQLEYENMKLRIENEVLKKGFLMKEDGTYVKFMK